MFKIEPFIEKHIATQGLSNFSAMNVVVQDFISSVQGGRTFGRSNPRPPVPGEENEKSSVSTHSSGSYRSHISSKSFSSSGKSASSHRSDASQKSQSPSGTPRKSNLNKTLTNSLINGSESILGCEDTNAPLGFEPEGSVDSSPLFTEGSPPAYLKWAESLEHLFEDQEGVNLFKQFLSQEHCVETVNFCFACNGIKLYQRTDLDIIGNLNKYIYKKFVKSDTLQLSANIKRQIAQRLRKDAYDQTIFDEAKEEVKDQIRRDTYPLFLKSDIYLEYVQRGGESPKTSNNSSESDSFRPPFGMLPTVHEDRELKSNLSVDPKHLPLSLTETSLLMTRKTREGSAYAHCERFVPAQRNRLPIPCHVSYAPVTAQDSELQSLSSDAQTDDAVSHTDSSRDGKEHNKKTQLKRHWKAVQENARTNCKTSLEHRTVPQMQEVSKNHDLAEKHPAKFAGLLVEELKALKVKQDAGEKLYDSFRDMEEETSSSKSLQLSKSSATTSGVAESSTSALDTSKLSTVMHSRLFTSTVETDFDDSAQSILEEHVSRVWEDGMNRVIQPGCESVPDEGRFQQAMYLPVSSSSSLADSSYAKMSQRAHTIQEGRTDVMCTRTKDGNTVALCNRTQSRNSGVAFGPRSDVRQSINDFRPPAEFQERVRHDMAQLVHENKRKIGSNSILQSGPAPNFHSTPKSKAARPVYSWSDSETWDDRNKIESAVEHSRQKEESCVAASNGHRSVQHDIYFCSQPNLQDTNRRRTMQSFGSETGSMLPPSSLPRSLEARNSKSTVSKMELFHCRSAQNIVPSSSVAIPISSLDTFRRCNSRAEPRAADSATHRHPSMRTGPSENASTVVGYYFGDEKIPYRTTIPGENITLAQFKRHLSKPGNYRYFFKKVCDEFDSGVVHEEFFNDSDILPLYEGKIWGKVERKQ